MTVGVFGEGVIDRFVSQDSHQDVIGGSALNAAVALRRAGVDAFWCARVSTDDDGQIIAEYASDNAVASERMVRSSEPTSIVTISTNVDGVPTYDFRLEGAVDWQWSPMELKHSLTALDIIQLSSLSCVLSPGADHLPGVLAELKTANPHVRITFDPNARPRAAKDDAHAAQMRHRVNQLVALSDLVKVSDEDLEWLSPGTEPSKTAATWSERGPSLVVLTCGAAGAKAFSDGELVAETSGVIVDVVDTVGAGDTFMAWLIRSMVEDFNNQIPQSPAEVLTMLQQAARAAAITCSRKGCVPPLRSEVL